MTDERMTDEQWQELAVLLENWWPGEWGEQRSEAYRLALERYPAEWIAHIIGRCAENGQELIGHKHRPSLPDLLEQLIAYAKKQGRALPAPRRPAGRNAPKLARAWPEGARARGPHSCGGMLMECEPAEARGRGTAPAVVQCDRCLEAFGTQVPAAPSEAPF